VQVQVEAQHKRWVHALHKTDDGIEEDTVGHKIHHWAVHDRDRNQNNDLRVVHCHDHDLDRDFGIRSRNEVRFKIGTVRVTETLVPSMRRIDAMNTTDISVLTLGSFRITTGLRTLR
jgi:hypothetical protein